MSKLDELIKELCPDGVEYNDFFSVCDYVRGITYNKNDEINNGNAGIKVFRANNITLETNTLNYDDMKIVSSEVKIKESQRLKKGDILICAGSGSKEHIGKVAYIFEDMEYTFGGFMGVIRPNSRKLKSGFLFHILTSDMFKKHLAKASGASSSTINNINNDTWKDFKIPVPPLPVQEEIVRILDTFTELTKELTKELTERRRQYEYYRDALLTFDKPNGGGYSRRVKLGEIAVIIRGGNFQKKDFVESGLPCIHYGQMYTHFGTWADKTLTFVSKDVFEKSRQAHPNDIIMAVTSENVEDVCKCTAWVGSEPVAVSGHTAIIRHNQNAKYLSYFFQSAEFYRQKVKLAHGTKVIEVTPDKLNGIEIPLPPLDVQERLVRVLDNFDSICSDLKIGLPAEIEARKKQYEFYRDALLTFAESGRIAADNVGGGIAMT